MHRWCDTLKLIFIFDYNSIAQSCIIPYISCDSTANLYKTQLTFFYSMEGHDDVFLEHT